jgi:polar amino acid transport system permease protein
MLSFYLEQLSGSLPFFLKGLGMTVAVSGLSLVAGTVIGFVWGIVRAKRVRVLTLLLGAWVDVIRGTPFLVQVFIIFFLLPEFGIQLEAFPAAVIALSNLAACFICEIVAAGIAAVPAGQREAATSTGLNWFQQLRFIVLPQAMRVIVPPLTNQYLNLTKNSSLAVAIGYPDVVSIANTTLNQSGRAVECIAIIMLVYLTTSLSTSALMNWYNKRVAIKER